MITIIETMMNTIDLMIDVASGVNTFAREDHFWAGSDDYYLPLLMGDVRFGM